ncbi:hypothetical protein SUGI_0328520 [Cryptomeria japonica]|nr:hypothetical protein SUGI_0328520 [Cryptomeria japonica]
MMSFSSSIEKMKSFSSITEEEGFQFTWDEFEDEVLRSWFVARVCRVDYVISRMGCHLLEMVGCTIVLSGHTQLEKVSLLGRFLDKSYSSID